MKADPEKARLLRDDARLEFDVLRVGVAKALEDYEVDVAALVRGGYFKRLEASAAAYEDATKAYYSTPGRRRVRRRAYVSRAKATKTSKEIVQ